MLRVRISAGLPGPMGATWDGTGVNFAVFSAHATAMELCLFSPDGRKEVEKIAFGDRSGDIWHCRVEAIRPGQLYGFRAYGRYAPDEGHRFNPHKLLIDPYARALHGKLGHTDAVMGYKVGNPRGDLSYDTRDSAHGVPKSVVVADSFDWQHDAPPRHAMADTVIYEAHVKAVTALHPKVPARQRGSYLGLASDPMLAHLKRLGVTAVELLPVQAFDNDGFVIARGLTNHWGYNTIGFFAPMARFARHDARLEFRQMVQRLHRAGIEVLLDVVYNHTLEGDATGPTLSFRGLDNRSYYRLTGDGRHYANDAGTGNTLNAGHPAVQRMILDSLRYWVDEFHVDGFRFDLAPVLGRGPTDGTQTRGTQMHGNLADAAQEFDAKAALFTAIRQDPVLSGVKLIAEPWDIGPGGYQLGAFPAPFVEWNDKYRDGVRRLWRGDAGRMPEFAGLLLGSAAQFDHDARPATSSVNFLTAHDGFTLHDLVSFSTKHNLANGEGNRDGHSDNISDNMGVEGATTDPKVRAARSLRKRNMLATLLVSQGTPMLLAGDEIGHSQGGNNNSYAQDNATTWIDWGKATAGDDAGLTGFVARLIALRKAHPVLRQVRFLHGEPGPDGLANVIWRRPDGEVPTAQDWQDPGFRCLGVELRLTGPGDDVLFLVFNTGPECRLTWPTTAPAWRLVLDTTRPDCAPEPSPAPTAPAQSVLVFDTLRDGDPR